MNDPSFSEVGPAQLSTAATWKALPGGRMAVHDTAGAAVSPATVTVWVSVTIGSMPSLPLHVTTFGPTANRAGALLKMATGRAWHTSSACAVPMLVDWHDGTVTSGGAVTSGVATGD